MTCLHGGVADGRGVTAPAAPEDVKELSIRC